MSVTQLQPVTSEHLLHYIWRTKQFHCTSLRLHDGRRLEILDFGRYNTNSGPDFLHGKIRIDDTILAGHIELHIKSSDWNAHDHHHDPAYNNVILHVVSRHDREIRTQKGVILPTLEISEYMDDSILKRYDMMSIEFDGIPCKRLYPGRLPEAIWNIWKERLNIERLQSRAGRVQSCIETSMQDWDDLLFRQTFICMGTNVNKDAFRLLADRLDHKTFMRIRQDEYASHAYVFGMAGLLEGFHENLYYQRIRSEFQFLKAKFDLQPLNAVIWKYSRMHPSNFPDIRIAQTVELLRKHEHFFAVILECNSITELRKVLEPDHLPEFWDEHYRMGTESRVRKKALGRSTRDLIIINGIIPLLFMYGHHQHQPHLQERALRLLEELPGEQNHIIRMWSELGIKSTSAQDSQALIQLKNNYCDAKRCLQCSIGHELLKRR